VNNQAHLFFILTQFLLVSPLQSAEITDIQKQEPKRALFVVETNEGMAEESLNRISGEIDLGFTTPDQSYKSENHALPGPLAREKEYGHSY
jgi:hypothetical protein